VDIEKGLVSIIIVGWNHWPFLKKTIGALHKQSYKRIEIIFVDNASLDNSVNNVRINFPDVKIIANDKNYGFCKGNNLGISMACGEFVLILNPDVILDKRCIEELMKASNIYDKTGICAPKIFLLDKEKIINSVGMRFNQFGRTYHIGDGEADIGQYQETTPIPMASGACMFCRREMFDNIGFFDEDYFAYYEDGELSLRAWWWGWKCIYVPTAIAYHMRNAAAKTYHSYHEIARFYENRNHYLILLTFMPIRWLIKSFPVLIVSESSILLQGLFRLVYLRKVPVEFKSRFATIKLLPKLIKKRQKLNDRCRITRSIINALIN
jgi:hypothetical protein